MGSCRGRRCCRRPFSPFGSRFLAFISSPKIHPGVVVAAQPPGGVGAFLGLGGSRGRNSRRFRVRVPRIYESALLTLGRVRGGPFPPNTPFPAPSPDPQLARLRMRGKKYRKEKNKGELQKSWKKFGSCEVLSMKQFGI